MSEANLKPKPSRGDLENAWVDIMIAAREMENRGGKRPNPIEIEVAASKYWHHELAGPDGQSLNTAGIDGNQYLNFVANLSRDERRKLAGRVKEKWAQMEEPKMF